MRSSTPFAAACCADRGEPFGLGVAGGDDQLAAVAGAARRARRNTRRASCARDAEPRHQAVVRIVDAGVDDLAVARGGDHADRRFALEHEDLAAGQRERGARSRARRRRRRQPRTRPVPSPKSATFGRVRGRLMLNASLKRAMRDCKSRGISWFIQHREVVWLTQELTRNGRRVSVYLIKTCAQPRCQTRQSPREPWQNAW